VGQFSLTQEQVAQRVGKDRATVANSLRLLSLPDEVQQMIEEDRLSAGHARALLMVADKKQQLALARQIIARGYSVREAESLARSEKAKAAPGAAKRRTAKSLDQYLANIQSELQRALGTKVRIRPQGRNKGKIEIEYFSADDMERIMAKLGIKL